MDSKILGSLLRDLRIERDWTLEEVGNRAGISKAMVSKIELGQTNVTIDTLTKLEAALGVTLTLSLRSPGKQEGPASERSTTPPPVDPYALMARMAALLPKLDQRELTTLEVILERLDKKK